MPLESLLELVETLRKRINEHGVALRQSEALTRYALIDPLLRELGWDTGDPAQVVPEFQAGRGRADYALHSANGRQGRPSMLLEAKKLGAELREAAEEQTITYCVTTGIRYFAVTDGKTWEFYDTFIRGKPLPQMCVLAFDLRDMTIAEVSLKSMALWRISVLGGSVSQAQTPIIESDLGTPTPISVRDIGSAELSPRVSELGWIAISDLTTQQGDTPPIEIQFPDLRREQIARWYMVVTESVRWLHSNRLIGEHQCPVQIGRRYVLSTTPIHSDGKQFRSPKSVGNLHVEVNYSAPNHVRNANTIIQHLGQDPSQFKVRFSNK